jgi:hypothetical protein
MSSGWFPGGAANPGTVASPSGNQGSVQNKSDELLTKISEIESARGQDEEKIRAGLMATVIGAVTAAVALSLIPFESNFGSQLAGKVLADLMSPAYKVAYIEPIMNQLETIFRNKLARASNIVQGLQLGAIDTKTALDLCQHIGLDETSSALVVDLGLVKWLAAETKDDESIIHTYQRDLLTYNVAAAKIDLDDAIADQKAVVADLKKGLPDGQAAYQQARTVLTNLKKQRANQGVIIYGAAVNEATARINTKRSQLGLKPVLPGTQPFLPPVVGPPAPAPAPSPYIPERAFTDGQTVIVPRTAEEQAALQACTNHTSSSSDWATCSAYDLNHDGKITLSDLILFTTAKKGVVLAGDLRIDVTPHAWHYIVRVTGERDTEYAETELQAA